MESIVGNIALCALMQCDSVAHAEMKEDILNACCAAYNAEHTACCAEATANNAKALANSALSANVSTRVIANCAVSMANCLRSDLNIETGDRHTADECLQAQIDGIESGTECAYRAYADVDRCPIKTTYVHCCDLRTFEYTSCTDYSCAEDNNCYDTKSNVCAVFYKPDQAVNTTSCVTFDTVAAIDVNTCNIAACNGTVDCLTSCNGTIDCLTSCNSTMDCLTSCNGTIDCLTSCNSVIDCLDVRCKVLNGLEIDGDLRASGTTIADQDLIVYGNLYINGTTFATSEEQVATKGDYIVTRDNNNAAMASTEYSGLAVNNYATNKIATLTADYCGEWRVSDSATQTAVTQCDISSYNGTWYNGLTQTTIPALVGIFTNVDMIELSNVALYTDNCYYHKNGETWYGPLSVVNRVFDIGDIITDTAKVTALDALTKYSIVYYNQVTVKNIDASQNQPLLTRDERSCFNSNDILAWDNTCHKATHISRPTQNNTALTAQIDSVTGCVSYDWKTAGSGAVCCYASVACYNAAVQIAEGCDGYIPDNALVIIDGLNNYLYGEEAQ